MLRVLKICGSTWENASRDKRELSVYEELGNEVFVLAKGDFNDRGREYLVDGFKVYRYTTRPFSDKIPNSINRIAALFIWTRHAKKLKPDVISGHDLIPALTISWLSTFFNKKKPILIYDSHEFELGRVESRGKVKLWMIAHWERFLMKQCAFSIMVNDYIADEVQSIYRLKEKPVVLRNTSNYWEIDHSVCDRMHLELLSLFSDKVDFIAMYHGAVSPIRGIELIMEAVASNEKIGLAIIGNGDSQYKDSLIQLGKELGIANRIYFHNAVNIKDLWKYVGAADVGVIASPAKMKNALYSLPNKFFENIQSETPVICPDYPAMKELVDRYQIGLTCDPTDKVALANTLNKMRTDKELYKRFKKNTLNAKRDLCWEKEKEKLTQVFKEKIMKPDA